MTPLQNNARAAVLYIEDGTKRYIERGSLDDLETHIKLAKEHLDNMWQNALKEKKP